MDIADVQCGDTLKEPDNPQKDGYKFIGWQDEETEILGFQTLSKEI